MGKSSPATSTQQTATTTQTDPWGAAQPYFPPLYQQGAGAVNKAQAAPLPTSFVAGENPTEQSAISQTLAAAPSLGASGQSLSDMATKIASGYFLNPQNDPTFAGAASAALAPVTQNVTEQLIPQAINASIKGGGVGGGPSAYGGANAGSAQDIENERIIRDYSQTAANTTAAMANASRNAGLNLIPSAPGIAAGANQQILAPATATGLAGTQQQQYAQNDIDNLIQQYQYATQGPFAGLQQFANLLTTGGFTSGTGTSNQTGTYTAPQPSLPTQILQGGLGGAGILASLFGVPASGTSAASNIWQGLSGGGSFA